MFSGKKYVEAYREPSGNRRAITIGTQARLMRLDGLGVLPLNSAKHRSSPDTRRGLLPCSFEGW